MRIDLRLVLVSLLILVLTGCQQMGPTEVGLRFRQLPALAIGPIKIGGVSPRIVHPGQLAVLMPWDSIYKFDTSFRDISWPSTSPDRVEGFVNTRALDGNEVALAVTVRYRVSTDPEKLLVLISRGATSDDQVRDLIVSLARADIRTYMNGLRTTSFLDESARYAAIDRVRDSLARRLDRYGIEINRVILDDFRFERLLRDGRVDASYQERITETQKLREDTEREKLRIETVRAKKQQEFNQVQASFNRQVAEAKGFHEQAIVRGDAILQAKVNEAKGILAAGLAEVEGQKQQIQALSGPGGESILKLEIAKKLLEAAPRFVVINPGGKGSLTVERMDANRLLEQIGVLEGLGQGERRKIRAHPAAVDSGEKKQ